MFKRKFARTIPENLRAPHMKMWGFEAKRARKFTRTSPRTLPWNFKITMLSAPLRVLWALSKHGGSAPPMGAASSASTRQPNSIWSGGLGEGCWGQSWLKAGGQKSCRLEVGMPLRKVHEPTFLWFGLPGSLLSSPKKVSKRVFLGVLQKKSPKVPEKVEKYPKKSIFGYFRLFQVFRGLCRRPPKIGRREKTPTPKTRFSICWLY